MSDKMMNFTRTAKYLEDFKAVSRDQTRQNTTKTRIIWSKRDSIVCKVRRRWKLYRNNVKLDMWNRGVNFAAVCTVKRGDTDVTPTARAQTSPFHHRESHFQLLFWTLTHITGKHPRRTVAKLKLKAECGTIVDRHVCLWGNVKQKASSSFLKSTNKKLPCYLLNYTLG